MLEMKLENYYDFSEKTVVITGGGGVLGSVMAAGLLKYGARVILLDLDLELARSQAEKLSSEGGNVFAIQGNVLDKESLQKALVEISDISGGIEALINAAGGNHPDATTSEEKSFFELPEKALEFVVDLNLLGTIYPSQIFGKSMAEQGEGVILNVSSMNAFRPLTRIPAYSAAKAAVSNFTQWLAVHIAREYSQNIRVNAIAPGFFLTQQNHFLLIDEKSGELTERGKRIIDHTPMGRFGVPEDLIGAVLWLLSPAAEFVTGVVLPIDGGFSAFSGV